ncbi:MAG: hypothetical protein IKZ09_03830 [Clostridia bacterium]|nr:hypothetical protein [Clostridia bacterium]
MTNITIRFSDTHGPIKPMHAVNNGPAGSAVRGTSNIDLFRAAGIPYARNHDAAFYSGYGGEHTVDVHRIFKNFDADENCPENYVFGPTDEYIAATEQAGTKTFYRLGAAIEHGFKQGTYPPKDFLKWAKICEHIIRHYTEGWADGFTYDIEYWEIWNEPDCRNRDGSNPCWQGTDEEFIAFYNTAATYLKSQFPHLKIGGPAFCSAWPIPFKDAFLKNVKENNIPLDFYSYHCYGRTPSDIYACVKAGEDALAAAGLAGTMTILNEWNYIRGWFAEDWRYSLRMEKALKGASFIAGTMCAAQASSLGMLMYYDARPCGMNGMFDTDTLAPLKGYYPFPMFNVLYGLGTYADGGWYNDGIHYCAATDGENSAALLTYYVDDDAAEAKDVTVTFEGAKEGTKVSVYLLDETHNNVLVSEEYFTSSRFAKKLHFDIYTTYLIRIDAE